MEFFLNKDTLNTTENLYIRTDQVPDIKKMINFDKKAGKNNT